MDVITEKLLSLQDKDFRIFNLKKQIESIPEEKNQCKLILESHEQESNSAKNALLELESDINALELEINAYKEKIRNLHNKSSAIKKNEDYHAYLKEVKNFELAIKDLEDRELELWEKLEGAKARKIQSEKALQAAKVRVQASVLDLDSKEKNCLDLIEKMLQERQTMLEGIPSDILSSYERFTSIINSAGNFRKGLVTVQNDNCGGCFLKVTPNVRAKLKRGELTQCENCGTLLYSG